MYLWGPTAKGGCSSSLDRVATTLLQGGMHRNTLHPQWFVELHSQLRRLKGCTACFKVALKGSFCLLMGQGSPAWPYGHTQGHIRDRCTMHQPIRSNRAVALRCANNQDRNLLV